jgi:hypothetical protein
VELAISHSKRFVGAVFLAISALVSSLPLAASSDGKPVPDAKAMAVKAKIDSKLAALENERKIKISKIKARKYPAEREKTIVDKINLKIDRAVQAYKDKGNAYFKKRGFPEPWKEKKPPPPKPTAPRPKPRAKPTPPKPSPPPPPAKQRGSAPSAPTKPASIPPAPPPPEKERDVSQTPPKLVETATVADSAVPAEKTPESGGSRHVLGGFLSLTGAIFLFLAAAVLVVLNVVLWKKRGVSARLGLGCAALLSISASLGMAALAAFLLIGDGGGDDSTAASDAFPSSEKVVDDYYAENTESWQRLGARLYAESVAENDRGKLLRAIQYLEKASFGAPDNDGITVDLADAYMRTGSPRLIAVALDLYESVFDSFDNDPVLERLVSGYAQIGNHEVAYALSEARMRHCPDAKRVAAAAQMSLVALGARKAAAAETALSADIARRGDAPALELFVASLREGRGDKTGALEIIDKVLADSSLDSKLRAAAETARRRVESE